MTINGTPFVYDPTRQNPNGTAMTAGQQLFEAAYGNLVPPVGPLAANQRGVLPVGGTPALQAYDEAKSLAADGRSCYSPTDELTQRAGYDFDAISAEAANVRAVNQRGIGVTSADSGQPMLGTDGLTVCVAPIAYSPSTGIAALAHIDPPSDLTGFADDFLSRFPRDDSPIRLDFVGGSPESAIQQVGEGNNSRRHLTSILQQLHDRPDSARFDIQSFDVMNRRHASEIILDTRTGHLYPQVKQQGYDHSLESNFREMPGGKYSSKPSAEMAGVLTANGVNNVRTHFDGTDPGWLQQEQNAIARGYINDTVGMLNYLGAGLDMAEVRQAMSAQLNDVMGLDADAMRGMEHMLIQSHATNVDHTDPKLQQADSLAQQCMTKILEHPANIPAAVRDGYESWKDIQATRMAQAIGTSAEAQGLPVPSQEALIAAVRHGLDDKAFLAIGSKMGADNPAFEVNKRLDPSKLNNILRTAQCLQAVSEERRMDPAEKQQLMNRLAPGVHQELAAHPEVPLRQASNAIFNKLLDDGHLEKEQMGKGSRVLDSIQNRDNHKPVRLGSSPSKPIGESVHTGVHRESQRLAIGGPAQGHVGAGHGPHV
jgi:hypothetical protein